MKKILLLAAILSFAFVSYAQVSLTFTPATNDSIVGAATKYCTLAKPITMQYSGAIEIYITSSVGANDSTWVTVQGSMNDSTWYDLDMGTPVLTGSAALRSSQKYVAIGAESGSILWQPTWFISPLYLRLKVQHYVAATSIKITRATIYLKK